ncbi:MAG: UDP-N-acetylglucosamine 2-epimerase (non-hydrolyzing) [Oscillospiraceae bacterium]|nr:UDP-N-acetylglucosamine 2-epimerase (non-hydrolyzing) [Oscillospiraceae bacterium]
MDKKVIMSVFGTRPEAIKMAPLVRALQEDGRFQSLCCLTGQHREMLDSVMDIFRLHADYDLNIMEKNQTLSTITTKTLLGMEKVIAEAKPDLILVHGDTTTTFAGALSAFYQKVPVGHVEAGLRTFDKYSPYPEEMNRNLVGKIAQLHFAPTRANADNLRREQLMGEIFITGNTVIDAMKTTVAPDFRFSDERINQLDPSRRLIVMTCHRRENYGEPMAAIMRAVRRIALENPDLIVIYPVHLSPVVQQAAHEGLDGLDNVLLIDPIDVEQMHNLMARSYLVLTDSGGLQEEAPALGKPVLVMRRETERPEAIHAGTARLVGVDEQAIVDAVENLLNSQDAYSQMAHAVNPYGDGNACSRIVRAIAWSFGMETERPQDFIV